MITDVDQMREAASRLRYLADPEQSTAREYQQIWRRPDLCLAMACWLDAAADVSEANYENDGFDEDAIDDTYRGALRCARVINRDQP